MKVQIAVLFWLVTLIWSLELADLLFFRGALDGFGIWPRRVDWLWGILFAPFLHGGLGHLVANTGSLLFLGWLVLLRRVGNFLVVTVLAILTSGLGVWLFGRPGSIHIGASGLVFGYLGYLLLRGYFERSVSSIVLSVVIGLLYGGALSGLLPGVPGVSWEGHLFGFFGGAGAARLLARPRRPW